jgi:putative ABC transport system substrate-binding protein
VDVIVATNTPGALAAKSATSILPIVFNVGIDPIEAGLVSRLNRPGSNLTGVSTLNVELASKQLEMLHEVIPAATDIAILTNPSSPAFAEPLLKHLDTAARTLGLNLHMLQAGTDSEVGQAFDLPVEQVTKIELVLNLNAAKALGVSFPPSVLARADEVIE